MSIKIRLDCLASLRRDVRGIAAVEFGLVAPVFIVMLLGLFDVSHQIYTTSAMQGALQNAARDSALERGLSNPQVLDAEVTERIRMISPKAAVNFKRTNYQNFEDVNQPENFTDTDGDGICNNNEPFDDVNNNGIYDTDRGRSGTGGARDAVLYTVNVNYDRLLPLSGFIGLPDQINMSASTVLRNQPFTEQGTRRPVVGNCT